MLSSPVLAQTTDVTPPVGIYLGTFSSNIDDGNFALLLQSDETAQALLYDEADQNSAVDFLEDLEFNEDGTLTLESDVLGSAVTISFSLDENRTSVARGAYADATVNGVLQGTESPTEGDFADVAGLYVGTLAGNNQFLGAFTGQLQFIVDAAGDVVITMNAPPNGFRRDGGHFQVSASRQIDDTLRRGLELDGELRLNCTASGRFETTLGQDPTTYGGTWQATRTDSVSDPENFCANPATVSSLTSTISSLISTIQLIVLDD